VRDFVSGAYKARKIATELMRKLRCDAVSIQPLTEQAA